jgi:AbiU2
MLTREDRIRRVVLLCTHFARNLAYYRFAWSGGALLLTNSQFWRTVNGNCIDICVLEWCKLFGDYKGAHHWKQIVQNKDEFEVELHRTLGITKAEFSAHIKSVREYRDKFIAHLDQDLVARIPSFDIPKNAVWFYLTYLIQHESVASFLYGFDNIDDYYVFCEKEAKDIYSKFIS